MNERTYLIPKPLINIKEEREIIDLTDEYQHLLKADTISKVVNTVNSLVPRAIKNVTKSKISDVTAIAKDKLSENDLYNKSLDILDKTFSVLESFAVKITLNEKDILKQISNIRSENPIKELNEICLLRSYDISKLVNKNKYMEIIAAVIEGAATGAPGIAGIPFNLLLSSFLYYVTVQSIAQFYGYDVKNNSAELEIASEVFMQAINPQNIDSRELSAFVARIMSLKSERGLISIETESLLYEMRSSAENIVTKASNNSDRKDFEKNLFAEVFEISGKKLAQKAILKTAPFVGAVVGGILDHRQMVNTIKFAQIFYCKRFVFEKEERINRLVNQSN